MIDKDDERAVSTEEGKAFAEANELMFIEASARTGINVKVAFMRLFSESHKKLASSNTKKALDGGSAAMVALAAELSKHTASLQKIKQAGGVRAPKAHKKSTLWQLQDSGRHKQSKHDVLGTHGKARVKDKKNMKTLLNRQSAERKHSEMAAADQQRMEALERKAQIYDAIKRGEKVPDRIRDELLIEYDRDDESDDDRDSDSDREGGLSAYERAAQQKDYERRLREREERATGKLKHDPWVEHVDEFGRTRLVRQSELPPPPSPPREHPESYQSTNPFPVFRRQDMMAPPPTRSSLYGEYDDSSSKIGRAAHYDSKKERRAQGVGFYTFSKDEEERRAQMEQLRNIRAETERRQRSQMFIFDKRRADIAARKLKIQAKREKSLANTLTSPTTA
ncbi:hypothetical protein BGZ73_005375 [Actinomortierella ambigua]|nr:hypothetical protein BGZ73_005375 [Actinomortierella ambigua]